MFYSAGIFRTSSPGGSISSNSENCCNEVGGRGAKLYRSFATKGRWSEHQKIQFGLVRFSRSVVYNSATPWTAARQASLSITNSQSLLKLISIELVMPSNHHVLCHPLLLLPSIFPSIRVFSNELVLHITWPKYWSFSFTISPSSEYSGLISFGSPCSPRDSQESSLTPQFKSIHSSALSFLYSPTLTSIHDYWKNHSFD